jgi:hypothetical protein
MTGRSALTVAPSRGRRSLSGAGDSPQIRVRVPAELRARAEAIADREHKSISELAREALEARVEASAARPEVLVQIELHKALLAKLIGDLGEVRTRARRNLARSRSVVRGRQAQDWLDEWSRLIDGPPSELVEVFLGEDEHSIDLRQVSPFAGVLSEDERKAAIRRARTHASH